MYRFICYLFYLLYPFDWTWVVLMTYEINNIYGYDEDYSYLDKVIKKTLKLEKVKKAVFSITFVGNEEIKRINKEYRSIDKVTDVISFAFLDNLDFQNNEIKVLGDIYICIPKMLEQAEAFNHSRKRELAFLTVHGLLHLLGYDHIEKEDEEVMFHKQEVILNATNIKK